MINNKYPTTKPSLNLDFANTKSLDPRITFRRGTPGTYYDGVTHAKAEENLVYPSIPDNNWSASGYTVTTNSTTAPDGTTTASKIVLNNTTTTASVRVDPSVSINNFYTFSIYAKAGEFSVFNLDVTNSVFGDTGINVDLSIGSIIASGSDNISSSITDVGNGWYRIVMVGKSVATGTTGYIIRNVEDTGDGSSGFYLWGAQLEQRDAVTSYTATNGAPITKYQPKLMTAAADRARFDHDPITGESKGLLIEEQRTNLLTYSQQIELQTTNTSDFNRWIISTTSNGLLDSNASIAPDGTLSASRFYANTDLASPATFQQVYYTDTTPETLTFSVFAKAGQTNRYLQLLIGSGDVAGNPFANFNLFDGTISRDDSSIASIEDHGNGWYRCVITFTTVSTSGILINPVIYLIDDDNAGRDQKMTGDSYSGIYIWGAQLETGSFATSYIKTTGASATRSADNASITGENFSSWYRQDEGSILFDLKLSEDSNWKYIFGITNNGEWEQGLISARHLGSSIQSNLGSIDNNSSQVGFVQGGNFFNLGFAYKDDSAFINTNIASDEYAPKIASGLNRIDFFSINGSDYKSCGHIKKLAYYPQRLTNEQLQNLTK